MIHRTVLARPPQRRGGFTLVELLIVMTIIAVLTGLVVAAVFGFIDTQSKQNTTLLLQKCHDTLTQRWSETSKDFRGTSSPPPSVFNLAGQDPERAKVVWMKLQLRRRFPMNYEEINNPGMVNGVQIIPYADLPAFPEYVRALQGRKTANDRSTESAACLLLALQRVPKGMKFSIDEALGPNAVKDTDGDGVPEIVDSWGRPVAFFRWGTGNAALDALSKSTNPNHLDRDTEDQGHTLMNATWNIPSNGSVALFEQLCHKISLNGQPWSYFTIPVVVSAGKSGNFGLKTDPATARQGAAGLLFTPDMAPVAPGSDSKAIYSFRTH